MVNISLGDAEKWMNSDVTIPAKHNQVMEISKELTA